MISVFLHACGLVSALGPNLPSALARLQNGGVEPNPLAVSPDTVWPCFTIADEDTDWYARARRLTLQAVAECGELDRDAPLFLASCSLDVGAVEDGTPYLTDCQAFAETVVGWLDWRGPVFWISTACSSASNALLAALNYLQSSMQAGPARCALVLGMELRNRFTYAGFGAMQLLDTQRPRPLSADRAGLVLGEAVAALYLSTEPSRWRLCGGANVVDGSDPAGATSDAVQTMVKRALADAGLMASDIDLIKLQAAGSPGNDATELAGLRAAFGTLPALVSLKAEIGHTLGASGAAELALLMACLENKVWPAPRCAADPALGAELASEAPGVCYLMSNILGFGGGHATVIVEDCASQEEGFHRRGVATQKAAKEILNSSPDAGQRPESGALPPASRVAPDYAALHPGYELPADGQVWHIAGRCFASPPPADWREQLAVRLGFKPRRIGRWAELALYGALRCLDEAGEATLPADALLSLASLRGPDQALRASLAEAADGMPLPLGFLQSQPNQALAHLCKALNWQGDARCLTTRDPLAALRLACASAGPVGVLLGWIDEDQDGASQWLRLLPMANGDFAPLPETLAALGDPTLKGFGLRG
ncbi:hypothetical protein GCM10027046_12150 [Uliginosibacterium flavum]|uniref:Beta-ketoacyl synthase N-terminal-like domain-containing protein n=1 Tax=Uliginosibacterium flavum TaxID=1396831 RepID=A0ABV2TL49_9RHOO